MSIPRSKAPTPSSPRTKRAPGTRARGNIAAPTSSTRSISSSSITFASANGRARIAGRHARCEGPGPPGRNSAGWAHAAAFPAPSVGRVATRYLHDVQPVGVELECGERPAPDCAGIERMHAVADEQPERRPVPAGDLQVPLGPARHLVPGIQAGLLRPRRALFLECDPS